MRSGKGRLGSRELGGKACISTREGRCRRRFGGRSGRERVDGEEEYSTSCSGSIEFPTSSSKEDPLRAASSNHPPNLGSTDSP